MKRKLISAIEVAKLLLSFDPEREYFRGGKLPETLAEEVNSPTIGNFRLNKMLHICQMLHYSKYDEPLFSEELRAYAHGAIVYPIYKGFFNLYRENFQAEEIKLAKEKKSFIHKIFDYFKNYQDEDLETFSHDDIAWREAWENNQDDDRMVINKTTKNFYRDLLGHIVREVEHHQVTN